METQSQITKIVLFIIINATILSVLYAIPVNSVILENLCIYKLIFGKECWNCGMTRAFLSILHCNIRNAINYNNKVILVFPMTIVLYLNTWYKCIVKQNKRGQN